ncbi:MAG: hypothetical protein EOP93_07600 [Lysobacteraceae bacterium]|nr:MAG: hypothetical protein EOP93_07600 [Xanthomonadaceae bacterium]
MLAKTLGIARAMAGAEPDPAPLIDLDPARFDPWQIQGVRHRLSNHPLLQLPALVELGKRLEARGSIRTHNDTALAGTPFTDAPGLHPNEKSASATLAGIEDAHAWMSLLNVQLDPVYRELVGTVLESVRPLVERHDPGMTYRGGWIFVTSPGAVTPFHFDKEHNFILQIRGHKRVFVWDHRDEVVASEQAREEFHRHHVRDRLAWREEFRERARVFELAPGEGAYMPSTSPHMVENGDEPSVTASFTYYTASTRRDALLHVAHHLMRRAGWTPPAVGRRPAFDVATHACAAMVVAGLRLAGKRVRDARVPFAVR